MSQKKLLMLGSIVLYLAKQPTKMHICTLEGIIPPSLFLNILLYSVQILIRYKVEATDMPVDVDQESNWWYFWWHL
jgi:hypothetical protein